MVWAVYLEQVPHSAHAEVTEALAEPWAPVRALHGTSPAQRRAQRAMMDLAGGPAPMRRTPPSPAAEEQPDG